MANPKHVAVLKQGLRAWNKWRRWHPGIKPDLRGAEIGAVVLAEVILCKAGPRGVTRVRLPENILDAFLRGVFGGVTKVEVAGVNLRRADLREAVLGGGADLTGADLRGADLSNAKVRGAVLAGVKLKGAKLRNVYLGAKDLNHADLRGVDLRGADLSSSDLKGSNLCRTDLRGADLSRADLGGAVLGCRNLKCGAADIGFGVFGWYRKTVSAVVGRADLRGADLRGATGLTQSMINSAKGDWSTRLPEGIERPKHWREPTHKEEINSTLVKLVTEADRGDSHAQLNLGNRYARGTGCRRDYSEAARWWRRAAEQGDPTAQRNLAILCYKGQGVPHDESEAAKWWRRAAEQGDAFAQFSLAAACDEGRTVPQDDEEAAYWCGKAADQGYPPAQYKLGESLEKGRGCLRDYVQAHKWYTVAAAAGHQDSAGRRNHLALFMTSSQITEAQALARQWTHTATRRPAMGLRLDEGGFPYDDMSS